MRGDPRSALEKPPLPLTSVHRQAKQFAHLVGEPAPSYWVVRDIVLSLHNDPDTGLTPEVVARLVRMTGGNLRLLTRLLTQVERVLGVNDAQVISVEIVETARDSLVIGQA